MGWYLAIFKEWGLPMFSHAITIFITLISHYHIRKKYIFIFFLGTHRFSGSCRRVLHTNFRAPPEKNFRIVTNIHANKLTQGFFSFFLQSGDSDETLKFTILPFCHMAELSCMIPIIFSYTRNKVEHQSRIFFILLWSSTTHSSEIYFETTSIAEFLLLFQTL